MDSFTGHKTTFKSGKKTKAGYSAEDWKQYIEDRVIVDPVTGCWIWRKAILKPSRANPAAGGYGMMLFYEHDEKKMRLVHTVAYELWIGPIPTGRDICHWPCNNKACCNPDHLYAGTPQQNIHDSMASGTFLGGNPKGGPHTKGSKWYTNGLSNCRWSPGKPIPSAADGWRPGQTADHSKQKRKRKNG